MRKIGILAFWFSMISRKSILMGSVKKQRALDFHFRRCYTNKRTLIRNCKIELHLHDISAWGHYSHTNKHDHGFPIYYTFTRIILLVGNIWFFISEAHLNFTQPIHGFPMYSPMGKTAYLAYATHLHACLLLEAEQMECLLMYKG